MQYSSLPTSSQADKQRMLERIDRLESMLRERQQALGAQLDALQGRLAQFGLETAEKIADAYGQLEASQRADLQQQLRPPATAEPGARATAYRRIGRLV